MSRGTRRRSSRFGEITKRAWKQQGENASPTEHSFGVVVATEFRALFSLAEMFGERLPWTFAGLAVYSPGFPSLHVSTSDTIALVRTTQFDASQS